MKALEEMFLQSLEGMYAAERRIAQALPELIAVATCAEVKLALKKQLAETQGHIRKLEEVFDALGATPRANGCAALAEFLGEAEELAYKGQASPGLNTAIVTAVQKMKHYEIANYGCLHSWAQAIEHPIPAEILNSILDHEKMTYYHLGDLAMEKDEELLSMARN